MPSSSLFLGSSATLVSVLSLISSSIAAPTPSNQQVYTNVNTYVGADFENLFNFWDSSTTPDPNNGFVNYVDRDTAINKGIVSYDSQNFYMKVDSSTVYNPNVTGAGRTSARLTSQASWDKGLFILDLSHMPGGVCGVWPAFWTLGANVNWPYGGEIDIVESVNDRNYSLAALHDGYTSVIDANPSILSSGSVQATNCQYYPSTGSNAAGCTIFDNDQSQYGIGLNKAGGGVIAMEWTDDVIQVWHFNPGNVPRDLTAGNPNPSAWGLPTQKFAGANANIATNILAQNVVINTNFCGDFGNAVWSSEGCAAKTGYNTCNAFVAANPNAFTDQYWAIRSLKIYSLSNAAATTSSSTSSSTTSSSMTSPTVSTVSTSSSTSSTTTSSFTGYSNTTTTNTWTIPSGPSAAASTAAASWGQWAATSDSGVTGHIISATGLPGFPMGGAAPPSSVGPAGHPAEPRPTFITTTITTTFVVPCPTGWSTSTVSIVTSYAGGKPFTYLPTAPVTTYTTSVPAGWGLGKGPITVTIPITTTKTIVVGGAAATGNGNGWGSGSGSGSNYGSGSGSGSSNSNSDGNNWSGSNSPDATSASASTWNTWSSPAATATPAATWAVPDGTSATGTGAAWSSWTGSATTPAASASATWASWSNSNVADPIAAYTGAATRVGGSVMAVIGAAVVGVLMM